MKKKWRWILAFGISLSLIMTVVLTPAFIFGGAEGSGSQTGGSEELFALDEFEEPDGSGIPKDEPVSTTKDTYGYKGGFDLEKATPDRVSLTLGKLEIHDQQMLFWGGTVLENGGSSSLIVRDSYVRGETARETVPQEGNQGSLLVAGNIRTTLGTGNSESIYINSTIVSRNGAALSTDAAKPVLKEGQKELGIIGYGAEAITMDGGYGASSDLFCNLFSYGSHIQGAEIGIISGTYGTVTVGTLDEGKTNAALAAVLTDHDRSIAGGDLPSVIEGGRNALMVHSINLPSYWKYEGYSQNELPLRSAVITGKGSVFRTDLNLDKKVAYEPQKQAYIDHTAGSVVLIKSTNVEMNLEESTLEPDPNGTGYLIQTVYSNDTMFMNAVPDGKTYPGVRAILRNMNLKGDIAHEDYQRDFHLVLAGSTLTGALNEYDCQHWNQAGAEEGFTDYCLDEDYHTHHGLMVDLAEGSVWNVTEESHLSELEISQNGKVNGIIYVDGVQKEVVSGTFYKGNIVVLPSGDPWEEAVKAEPEPETTKEPEPETTKAAAHVHSFVLSASVPATCTKDGSNTFTCSGCGESYTETIYATGHNYLKSGEVPATCTKDGSITYTCAKCGDSYVETIYTTGHHYVHSGGSPADCIHDGTYGWVCTECGDSYLETLYGTALGHDWHISVSFPATCVSEGQDVYTCSRCGEVFYDDLGYGEHSWAFSYSVLGTCMTSGYDVYICSYCGQEDWFNFVPAPGHDYVYAGFYDDVYHYYECTRCGGLKEEPHTGYDPCWCGHTGPVG